MSTASIQSSERVTKVEPTLHEQQAYKHLAYSNCAHVLNTGNASFFYTMKTSADDRAMELPADC